MEKQNPPQSSAREIQNTYEKRVANPISPVIVKDPPCQENVMSGTDILPRVSFNEVYPEEIKDEVLQNWKNYGFK